MGWMISVGRAGAKGSRAGAPALSVLVDVQGTAARVMVYPDAERRSPGGAGANPAWQAQRVWQNVLSTLVGN